MAVIIVTGANGLQFIKLPQIAQKKGFKMQAIWLEQIPSKVGPDKRASESLKLVLICAIFEVISYSLI
ncbi:hypothetical protein N7517_002536 [Penicillium concentricum]|uniref:Uncharacterized protein n=1 Tax=Penicillium concentricum TaxID=293559 RepID=A0A9W9VLG2_9EURO|nr:uncharacterized protein N7517_002536 [Penicillium concentricum]KAJ5384625.1 hypothetical protein N7517_002536 [Penicillium concentricum]